MSMGTLKCTGVDTLTQQATWRAPLMSRCQIQAYLDGETKLSLQDLWRLTLNKRPELWARGPLGFAKAASYQVLLMDGCHESQRSALQPFVTV